MKIKIILTCFVLQLTFSGLSHAQMKEDLREYFMDGEYFIAYGDYKEALFNFMNILKKGVNNANIQYRVGLCYINLEGNKEKAIPYLTEAVKSVTQNYDEGNPKEFQAPVDAYFYLGVAYQVNKEFDNAIENYRKYLGLLPKEDQLSRKFAKKEIEACLYAKEAIKKPKDYQIEKMSERINNSSDNIRPLISGDDSTFVYMTKLKFYDAIFITSKENGKWLFPKNINQEVLSDGDLYVTGISYDGNMLLMERNDNFDSDIYMSKYSVDEKRFMPFEKLRGDVNSKFWESHATLSKDGKTLYFTSNRRDAEGGMDIFYCEMGKRGKWDKAKNIGGIINTAFNEATPFVTNDGKRLYFSSQGHDDNMGGYDIFYSEKRGSSSWSKPVNIGYPINTPDDDMFFVPSANGNIGYFSRKAEKDNQEDIFKVVF